MPKKLTTTIYITKEQQTQLKELNDKLKVPVAELIRQGIDIILKQYTNHLSGQMDLPFPNNPKK